jgi:uncharacterized protein
VKEISYVFKYFLFAPLAFALLAPLAAVHAAADQPRIVRSISMSGHGEARAVPDLASISMGVMTSGATAQEALAANTAAMTKLLGVLKAAGIEEKDTTTSNFSVGPRYDFGQGGTQPPKVVGYDVNNMVTVVVRKTETLGTVLDAAVSAGSNQIQGIMFTVSKPEAMLDIARKEAVAEARRKAELYATAGGFALGQIISLNEGGSYQPPVPVLAKAMAADAAGAVPIAQGEQTLGIDVNIVWEIK